MRYMYRAAAYNEICADSLRQVIVHGNMVQAELTLAMKARRSPCIIVISSIDIEWKSMMSIESEVN